MTDIAYWKTFLAVYAFCWGAIWGSFLNVVIWRLPRGKSLSHPPSHCPICGTPIKPWDNVPIFAWLIWLRGKCRACGTPIPVRYPAIELLTGVLGLALWLHVSADTLAVQPLQVIAIPFFFHFFFMTALVSITCIDLDIGIIPNKLTAPFTVWGLIGALIWPKTGVWTGYFPSVDIFDAGIGFVAGWGVVLAIYFGYRLLTGKEGMGLGDGALLGMIGANLGWQSLLFVMMFASFQGLLYAFAAAGFESWQRRRGVNTTVLWRGVWKDEYWKSIDGSDTHGYVGPSVAARTPGDACPPSESSPGPAASIPDPDWQAAPSSTSSDGDTDAQAAETPGHEDEEAFMKMGIPFGPFLALAALEYIFVGRAFLQWVTAGAMP
jgi:leader peptidase (prepilin peptidase) / N-methyltransferase